MAIKYLDAKRIRGIYGSGLGSAANGTISGATHSTSSPPVGSGFITLDGNDYCSANGAKDAMGATGTISCWFYFTNLSQNDRHVWEFADQNATQYIGARQNSSGHINIFARNSDADEWSINGDSSSMAANTWYQMVVTHDGIRPYLYFGAKGSTITDMSNFGDDDDRTMWISQLSIDNFSIGRYNHNGGQTGNNMTGGVDDFACWNRVLTTTEIEKLHFNNDSPSGTPQPASTIPTGLRVHFPFDSSGVITNTATLDDDKATLIASPTLLPENTLFDETDTQKTYWLQSNIWHPRTTTYGMFMGGHVAYPSSGYTAEIQRTTIGTSGSVEDFGDLSVARGWTMAAADATRGVCAGGGVYKDEIDYVTVAGSVGGTATPWGADLSASREQAGSCCNETYALFAGGFGTIGGGSSSNQLHTTIDRIVIQTTGTVGDFGDLQQSRYTSTGTPSTGVLSSSHGMIFSGYVTSSQATVASIQYLPIVAMGTASDFGDCSVARLDGGAVANTSRALVAAGGNARKRSIDFFAVGTTGTASDFGDLNEDLEGNKGANNDTYGLFAGGWASDGGLQSAIEYVTINSEGNGKSFGDLHLAARGAGGCSA